MTNYFRITAYYPQEDITAILDTNGKYPMLWQFSAFLVSKGFKIIEVASSDKIVEGTFPLLEKQSEKILLRGIVKGKPEIQEMTYQERPCKAIAVYDKVYGQFAD